jgi:hypothetical protein
MKPTNKKEGNMWLIIFLVLGLFIYLIISPIIDSISDKIKQAKSKTFYGEEELFYVTTYQNANITEDDIMHSFATQHHKYQQLYFIIDYNIYNDKEKQNYAWSIKTTKQTFGWGIVYNILFHFSNGWVHLYFSDSDFYFDGKISLPYYLEGRDFGTMVVESTLSACRDEAKIIWKANGNEPTEYFPFSYISLSNNTSTSSDHNRSKKQKEKSTQADLLNFYRNLLGLKLHFSQTELKNAYREAVGKYHPDRYGASSSRDRDNAEMLMRQVNEAYEKLKEIAK